MFHFAGSFVVSFSIANPSVKYIARGTRWPVSVATVPCKTEGGASCAVLIRPQMCHCGYLVCPEGE